MASDTLMQQDWERLDELYETTIKLPADQVAGFCSEHCGGNPKLSRFVQELVASSAVNDEDVRDTIAGLAREVAAEESLTGQTVGAYQCGDLRGRGGIGEVYLATRADGEFDKQVAIKVISASTDRTRIAELFRTERQVMASLSHPSIPTLVDAGQLDDGRPYFICEYIAGKVIDEYCTEHACTTKQRLALLEKIANALQHAHANLVLHLDIKPDEAATKREPLEYARAVTGLASTYGQRGELKQSEPLFLHALALLERELGPDHYDLTRVLNSMGVLYSSMQRYDDARDVLKRSLDIRKRVLEPDHPQMAFTHLNIAIIDTEQKHYDEAVGHFQTALGILAKSFEPDDYRLALTRFNLGSTYERMNRLDDAEQQVREALNAWEGKIDPNYQYFGLAYEVLANVHEKRGENAAPLVQYERALGIFSRFPAHNTHRVRVVKGYARFLRSTSDAKRAHALESALREEENEARDDG